MKREFNCFRCVDHRNSIEEHAEDADAKGTGSAGIFLDRTVCKDMGRKERLYE